MTFSEKMQTNSTIFDPFRGIWVFSLKSGRIDLKSSGQFTLASRLLLKHWSCENPPLKFTSCPPQCKADSSSSSQINLAA